MVTLIFRLSVFAIVVSALLVLMTPVFTINKILFPVKIDSAWVAQQQLAYEKALQKGTADSGSVFLYSPSQLNMNYTDMEFSLSDSTTIRGWLAIDTMRLQSPLLLIIPDISEGAINYIPALKHFCDRGFNVCVMNMRGQGNSDGTFYNFSEQAGADVIHLITEMKKMPFIDRVAILGNCTGAAIALKVATDSASLTDVLILQNPPRNMARYFNQQAVNEWGNIVHLIMPALRRSYEQETNISIKDYDYVKMVKSLYVPQMIVAANFSSKKVVDETVVVYNASNYYRKRLFIDNSTYQKPTGLENSKEYYDKISAFINSSLPGKSKKTRFRKLAFN